MDDYTREQYEKAARLATSLEQLQGVYDAIEAVHGSKYAEEICAKYGEPLYMKRLDETQKTS